MKLILKIKETDAGQGVLWAAFTPEDLAQKGHPIVVTGARDEAEAKAEFDIYTQAYARTNGDTTAANNAVMAARMGK